jgi:phage host-nuclease inhibitor protein Gam
MGHFTKKSFYQGTLPRAVWTDYGRQLPAMNMEIYILQYYGTAYCDTEIFNFSAAKTAAFLTTGVLVKFFLNHKEPLPIL